MEQTKTLPPLVSDDQAFGDEAPFFHNRPSDVRMLNYLRAIYERDRQRTREVVQAMVNEGNRTIAFLEPLVEGWLADGDDEAARYPSDLCERLRTLLALAKSRLQIEPKP